MHKVISSSAAKVPSQERGPAAVLRDGGPTFRLAAGLWGLLTGHPESSQAVYATAGRVGAILQSRRGAEAGGSAR